MADAAFMTAIKLKTSKDYDDTETYCSSLIKFLHNLFKRNIIPKKLETLNDVQKFITEKIRTADFTEENDNFATTFLRNVFNKQSPPPAFKTSFTDYVESLTDKAKTAFEEASLAKTRSGFSSAVKTLKNYFHRSSKDERSSLLRDEEEDINYYGLRALAIVETLTNKIKVKNEQDRNRLVRTCAGKNTADRAASKCRLGYYENEHGCCDKFPSGIIFSTKTDDKSEKEDFERQFLNLTYAGYSVKEAVLISKIVEFLQEKMMKTISEIVDYGGRIRINPRRQAYGNLDCKTAKEKGKEVLEEALNEPLLALAGAPIKIAKKAVKTSLGAGRAIGSVAASASGAVYRKLFLGKEIKTKGEAVAVNIVAHLSIMMKIALSIYNSFVNLIIRQFIKDKLFKEYHSGNIEEYLLGKIDSKFLDSSIADYIDHDTDNHNYESFEDLLESSLNTLGETITASFQTIPGFAALGKLVVQTVTNFITKICVQVTLTLSYKNTLGKWLRDSNVNYHLKEFAPFFKLTHPNVYRVVNNVSESEWEKTQQKLSGFDINAVAPPETEDTNELPGGIFPRGGAGSSFGLDDLGGVKHKKQYRVKRSRSASKSKQKSKRARSKSLKKTIKKCP